MRNLMSGLAISCILLGLQGCATAPSASEEVRSTLAPTGKMRIAVLPGAPSSMVREPVTGTIRGVAVEVGSELARRLGVEYQLIEFGSFADVVAALTSGRADLAAFNASSAQAVNVLLSPPLYSVESGYLVPPGSRIQSIADIDTVNLRVGVQQNSTSQRTLTGLLKNATIVPVAILETVPDLLKQGRLDAFATNKAILFDTSDRLPGSKVLDGRYSIEHQSIAIPKGREAASDFMQEFIRDVLRSGLVAGAAGRARLRGYVIQ